MESRNSASASELFPAKALGTGAGAWAVPATELPGLDRLSVPDNPWQGSAFHTHSLQAAGMWHRASLCQSLSKPGEFPVSPIPSLVWEQQRGSWSSSPSIKPICICISWECPADIHWAGEGFSRSHEKLGVPGSSPDPQPVLGQDLGFIPGACSCCLSGETPVEQRLPVSLALPAVEFQPQDLSLGPAQDLLLLPGFSLSPSQLIPGGIRVSRSPLRL